MARWAKPLTIIATTLALSGSPAVLSACLALCLQDMVAPMAPYHAGGQAAAATVAPHHGHHTSADMPTAPATEAAAATPDETGSTRLTARCGNCCPDAQLAFIAGPRVERTAVVSLGVAPTAAPASWLQPLFPGQVGLSAGPPVSPPPPFSAPLPLRI